MADIPINFEHNGIKYFGLLSPVHGAGQPVWHLYVNKFYFGRLRFSNGWVFDSTKMPEMADYFGDYITAWYQ